MDIYVSGFQLKGLSKINIILGKNGCGKSTLLTSLDGGLTINDEYGTKKYITPERGGSLTYEPAIEQQLSNDANWLSNSRRVNQFTQFRQQTMAQYRTLETSILRALEASIREGNDRDNHPPLFDSILSKINSLLDNIEIRRDPGGGPIFKIYRKSDGASISAGSISSGESELISLSIECLTFAESVVEGKRNVLFLDEPDVHLHPDLQAKFIKFIVQLVEGHNFEVIIATHSTPLLGELADYQDARVALMKSGDRELLFDAIDEQYKQILPVFGAHPLSNIFSKTPLLLLEGEDDVRIWQQVMRSSQGRISVYPVECGTVNKMNEYERKVVKITQAIYDQPIAYSLRDSDNGGTTIEDIPPVIRMKLSCRAAENLLLSEEVLSDLGTDWPLFKEQADKWLENNVDHPKYAKFKTFKDEGYQRKTADLKEIRILLIGIMGSDKPWEVLVGQVIAKQYRNPEPAADSIQSYLGPKLLQALIPTRES